MASYIAVIPASTASGRETIRALLASDSKPFVRGFYRDPAKAPSEFAQHPNFEVATGDVMKGTGLDFTDSHAVLYIPPPPLDGTDVGEFAVKAATNVENAIKKAPSVKKLVLHSAVGAHHDSDIGVLKLNHISDRILGSVTDEVLIVKPGWFYEMWAGALKTMQLDDPHFESPFSPPDYKIPMVSVKDVGALCAKALLEKSSQPGSRVVNLFGPRHYSTLDLKEAIEEVTGKQGKLITIEKDGLQDLFAKEGIPQQYVQEYVDMILSMLAGGTMDGDLAYLEDTAVGGLELVDVLRDMASR